MGIDRSGRCALGCILAAVAITRVLSIYSFYLYDDAFITFRYAANLAQGNGLVYNLGQRVQGTTSPLWALILAIPVALGIGLEISSRILGLILDLGVAAGVYAVLVREGLKRAALLFGFVFAADIYLAKIAVSGMESSLFLLGTAGAAALALQGRKMTAAAIAGLCYFLRPEALLFAVCLLGFVWQAEKKFPWKAVLIGAAVIVAGVAVEAAYFGDVIPQSVRGKFALPRTYSGLWEIVLFPQKDPVQAVLTITALLSLPYAWKVSRFARIYSAWSGLLFVSWATTGAHLWMWYCVPLFFDKVLLSAIGAARFFEKVNLWQRLRLLLRPAVLLSVVAALWIVLAVGLGPDRIEANVYSRIRAWSAEHNIRGQTAYGMDFGAFGYYTDVTMKDEPGLVYPPSLTKYRTDPRAILLGEKPEWAFVTCYDGNVAMMRSPELSGLYVPVIRFSAKGDTDVSPSLDSVSPDWMQDFILYKRKDL